MRWRRLDLKRVIAERFGVGVSLSSALCRKAAQETSAFSHISARPRHPAQDERTVEAFKNSPRALKCPCRRPAGDDAGRNLV